MTPTQYARVLARWWWLVLACAGTGLVIGMAFHQLPPAQYVASANVLLKPNPATNFAPADVSAANGVAGQRVQTYADIAGGSDVLAALSQEVGIPTTELADRLVLTVPPGTTVVTVSYTDDGADTAQRVTAAAAKAVVRTVRRAENRGDAGAVLLASVSNQSTAVAAVPQVTPWRNPGLTAAAGLLLGVAIAVAASRSDRRLRSPETVAGDLDAPVLVEVPVRDRRLALPRSGRDRRVAAAIAELRTLVLFAGRSTRNKGVCVALTSPSGSAALPRVASDLARSVAGTGASVLLVEADLRHPAVGDHLALSGDQAGLIGFLEHRQDDGDLVQHHADSGVDVIVGGRASTDSSADLLHSSAYAAVLDDAANRYDVVLVTAPGVNGGSDAAAVAAQADLTLVLVERGRTRRRALATAATTLRRVDSSVLGAVLLT